MCCIPSEWKKFGKLSQEVRADPKPKSQWKCEVELAAHPIFGVSWRTRPCWGRQTAATYSPEWCDQAIWIWVWLRDPIRDHHTPASKLCDVGLLGWVEVDCSAKGERENEGPQSEIPGLTLAIVQFVRCYWFSPHAWLHVFKHNIVRYFINICLRLCVGINCST